MVIARLKYLVSELTEEERELLKDYLKKDSHSANLFAELTGEKPPEMIKEKRGKFNKNLNDQCDELENQIIQILFLHSNSDFFKLGQNLFAVELFHNKGIHDLAWSMTVKTAQSLDIKKYGWAGVQLLQYEWENPQDIKNSNYLNVLKHFVQQFAGFNYHTNSDPQPDLVAFVEEYKKRSTSIHQKLRDINQNLLALPSEPFPNFLKKAVLIMEKARIISENSSFLTKDSGSDPRTNEVIQEFENHFKHHFYQQGGSIFLTAYLESLWQTTFALEGKMKSPGENLNYFNLTDDLIDDLTLRLEINRLLLRCYAYEPHLKGAAERKNKLREDFVKLIKKLDTDIHKELSVFLKFCCLVLDQFLLKSNNSTTYKYKNEITNYEEKYYLELLNDRDLYNSSEGASHMLQTQAKQFYKHFKKLISNNKN